MVYRVYTDAAVQIQEGYSAIAFLVLEGNKFIKSHSEIYREVDTSYVAESIAVGKALEFMINEVDLKEEDEVIVFCDSLYTFKFAKKRLAMIHNKNKFCSKPTNAYWLYSIYECIPKFKCKLSFSKVTSHQGILNPHSYVDRLAKVRLKLEY